MSYDTAQIRELLKTRLSDQELTELCFDHFLPVYEAFSTGMSRMQKIQMLIDYCRRHEQLDLLLAQLQKGDWKQGDESLPFTATFENPPNQQIVPGDKQMRPTAAMTKTEIKELLWSSNLFTMDDLTQLADRLGYSLNQWAMSGAASRITVVDAFVDQVWADGEASTLVRAIQDQKSHLSELSGVQVTTAQVTISVEKEIDEFKVAQEEFILLLSRLLDITPDQIRILRITSGSVLVTIEMPVEAARRLVSMYLRGDPVLQTLDISNVVLQKTITNPPPLEDHTTTRQPSHFHRLRLWAIIVALLATGLVATAWMIEVSNGWMPAPTPTFTPSALPVVKILSIKDGQQLSGTLTSAYGTYMNVPEDQDIWLVVWRGSTCYPMDGPAVKEMTGNWKHGLLTFFQDGIYNLSTVLADDDASAVLRAAVGHREGLSCSSSGAEIVETIEIQISNAD